MYKSPIDMLVTDIQHQIAEQQDEQIYKAVVSVGINVDKEELIRALNDDRRQYKEGYRDGRLSAMEELVRCKDCKQWCRNIGIADSPNGHCFCHDIETNGHDFCSYGERREGECPIR